jgi:hypothetical protein
MESGIHPHTMVPNDAQDKMIDMVQNVEPTSWQRLPQLQAGNLMITEGNHLTVQPGAESLVATYESPK